MISNWLADRHTGLPVNGYSSATLFTINPVDNGLTSTRSAKVVGLKACTTRAASSRQERPASVGHTQVSRSVLLAPLHDRGAHSRRPAHRVNGLATIAR